MAVNWRKLAQAWQLQWLFWPLLIGLFWGLDFYTQINHAWRYQIQIDRTHLALQQVTSGLAVLMLVPLVAKASKRITWAFSTFSFATKNLILLLTGSAVFALGHYLLIILFRAISYPLFGFEYVFSNFWSNLLFEYGKDVKIYAAMLAIIYTYRYWLSKQQEPAKIAPPADSLLVQSGRGESRINISDIQVIEAARNYLSIYTQDKEYLYRSTLGDIQATLHGHPFVQVHRSYLINWQKIQQSLHQDGGRGLLVMHNKQQIPVSRSYKATLKSIIFR